MDRTGVSSDQEVLINPTSEFLDAATTATTATHATATAAAASTLSPMHPTSQGYNNNSNALNP
jgi:hypothetical protein